MESLTNDRPSSTELRDTESSRVPRPVKWPAAFWFILKVLCFYHHGKVVTRRRCFQCHVRENLEKRRVGKDHAIGRENLDWLVAEYEPSSFQSSDVIAGEETSLIDDEHAQSEQTCEACETLWWNASGVPERYTEGDIGVGWWNHPGSGLLSALLIFVSLWMVLYDVSDTMLSMWARSEFILSLIIQITLFLLISIYPVLTFCSKLRSWFTTGVPNLSWASALNVRYLVRRAQMLDIGRRGLPGKPFLVGYFLFASFVSVYRFVIFTYIAGCGYRGPIIVTCVVGSFYTECYTLFMYVVYFVRTSFQRQFTLLTYYIKENEGRHLDACNGALFVAVEDYRCFRVLCNLIAFVMCPVLVFEIAANITNEYSLTDSCVAEIPASWNLMSHVAYFSWIEMAMVFSSYVVAIGGLQVEYLLNNFITNLFHLKSDAHRTFWKALLPDMSLFANESQIFLVTVVLSFMSFFTAINVGNQNQSRICNATYLEKFCDPSK